MTDTMRNDLVLRGITVVSGMASGVDLASHKGVLRAKGRTITVLGLGNNILYPPDNKELMSAIISSGAAITEFPFRILPEG